jgi:hypothetical protein
VIEAHRGTASFYVDWGGEKVTDPKYIESIKMRLIDALNSW